MILGECTHCATPISLSGNVANLLLGRRYFCNSCGNPGPTLREALGQKIRAAFGRSEDAEELASEEQGN